ncbi:MAG: tetratricopeptide repeat protein [Pseudomonadota bacterium]
MSTAFFATAALMVVVAFVFCALPLIRARRFVATGLVLAVLVAGSAALYPIASNYVPRSAAYLALTQVPADGTTLTREQAEAAAATLASELEANPDDYASWRLLGRVRLELTDYEQAEPALRKAMALSEFPDPELMVMLGEALSYGDVQRLPNEAIVLFIGAYEMAPGIPKAMWYGGLAYAARGDHARAADAWEQLLAQGAPDEISAILRERIIALRAMANRAVPADSQRSLSLSVSLAESLERQWPATARVFVSVRNPDSPGPPLAATQLAPEALPLQVTLDDSNAMLPGRNLSSADEYEIVARLSMSGDPLGGAGDYIGRLRVNADALDSPLALQMDTVLSDE